MMQVMRCACDLAPCVGAILVLGRDLVMVPKLIHPLPPSTPRSSGALKFEQDLDDDQEPPTPHPTTDTWMQVRCCALTLSVRACHVHDAQRGPCALP